MAERGSCEHSIELADANEAVGDQLFEPTFRCRGRKVYSLTQIGLQLQTVFLYGL